MAVLPILMPTEWMVYLHTQLQLGDLPIAPIVEYLTRSVSAVYAMHGVLLLFISFDLAKYRSLLRFLILGFTSRRRGSVVVVGFHRQRGQDRLFRHGE